MKKIIYLLMIVVCMPVLSPALSGGSDFGKRKYTHHKIHKQKKADEPSKGKKILRKVGWVFAGLAVLWLFAAILSSAPFLYFIYLAIIAGLLLLGGYI